MTFFPWDDINALETRAEEARKMTDSEGKRRATEELIDSVTELFEMDYFYGVQDASMQLGMSLEPNFSEMESALNKTFDGKGYKDRIREYMADGTDYDIARVISTDAHRIYNEAMYNSAVNAGATRKTWRTMEDPRVRDAHFYLDGVTVGIDDDFYTSDGSHAPYPGQFGVPDLDINCRCFLTYEI